MIAHSAGPPYTRLHALCALHPTCQQSGHSRSASACLCASTCQVARQEGEYLAALFSKNKLCLAEPGCNGTGEAAGADLVPLPKRAKPFR